MLWTANVRKTKCFVKNKMHHENEEENSLNYKQYEERKMPYVLYVDENKVN